MSETKPPNSLDMLRNMADIDLIIDKTRRAKKR